MTPLRNKFGVLQGNQIDETAYDLQRPVPGTPVVQLGDSNGLNAAVWHPFYIDPNEVTP